MLRVGDLETTSSLLQPAVILNIKNHGHNNRDYPKLVYKKPSLNWALKVNKNFISTLLHLNWGFLGTLACDCVKNWTQTHLAQCLHIFYSSPPKPLVKWEH